MKIMLAAAATAIGLAAAMPASATVWTSQAAFDAANPGLNQVTFPGTGAAPNGYTLGGVTFFGPFLNNIPAGDDGAAVNMLIDNELGGQIGMALPGSDAIGLLLSQGLGFAGAPLTSAPVSLVAYNGATVVYSGTPIAGDFASLTFFGLSGLGPITSLTISTDPTDQFPGIGLVEYGSAVPEPATWAMMLIGFAGLGAALRSTRRRAQVQAV